MKISNIEVSTYSATSEFSIGWNDAKGNRYHVWLNRNTRKRNNDTLYKNPALGTKYKGEGYFPTRHLDVTADSNLPTFEFAMQEATRLELFEKEEKRIADELAAEKAKNWLAYVERCKKEAGPQLYTALENLINTFMRTSVLDDKQLDAVAEARKALNSAQPEETEEAL